MLYITFYKVKKVISFNIFLRFIYFYLRFLPIIYIWGKYEKKKKKSQKVVEECFSNQASVLISDHTVHQREHFFENKGLSLF